MKELLAIVVYSCVAAAPFDSFNPHQLNAVGKFIAENPDTCSAEPAQVLDGVSVAKCRERNILDYMPGWLQRNPHRVWVGADCFARETEPLDLEALKRRMEARP